MKTNLCTFLFSIILFSFSCKDKEETAKPTPEPTYASMADFYKANAVKAENFTVSAANGGSFTSAKGTKVTIYANTLTDTLGNPITGNVNVEFKDIYKMSDMLLSDMPTTLQNGKAMKSGGEFFIRITNDSKPVTLAANQSLTVVQPISGKADTAMQAFVWGRGAGGGWGWFPANASVTDSSNFYVFTLDQFLIPVSSGTWCNSDNPNYFDSYPQSVLTINPDINPADYGMDVYLLFKGVNSMVHVYKDSNGKFTYNYSPVGLPCTVVTIGAKGGKVYASFTDITTTANQTVNVSLAETTESAFKAKLTTLN